MVILGCEMGVPPFKETPICRDSLAFTTDGFLLVAPLTQDSLKLGPPENGCFFPWKRRLFSTWLQTPSFFRVS